MALGACLLDVFESGVTRPPCCALLWRSLCRTGYAGGWLLSARTTTTLSVRHSACLVCLPLCLCLLTGSGCRRGRRGSRASLHGWLHCSLSLSRSLDYRLWTLGSPCRCDTRVPPTRRRSYRRGRWAVCCRAIHSTPLRSSQCQSRRPSIVRVVVLDNTAECLL